MLWFLYALVVQRIEQSRPKGLMWVRFLPRALDERIYEVTSLCDIKNTVLQIANFLLK